MHFHLTLRMKPGQIPARPAVPLSTIVPWATERRPGRSQPDLPGPLHRPCGDGLELDLQDRIAPLACGDRHFHRVPLTLAAQRAADGGLAADLGLIGISLRRPDNHVVDLFPGAQVLQAYLGADCHTVRRGPVVINHPGVPQHLLQLQDPPFHKRLLVLGIFVLGVFHQVAELLGLLDPPGDFLAADRLEVSQLLFQFVEAFWSEDRLFFDFGHRKSPARGALKTKHRRSVPTYSAPQGWVWGCWHETEGHAALAVWRITHSGQTGQPRRLSSSGRKPGPTGP